MKNVSELSISNLIATPTAALLACLISGSAVGQDNPAVAERMEQQMRALQAEKASRTPAQKKMDSRLIYAAREKRDGMALKEAPALRISIPCEADGRAKVDIDARVSPALLAAIRAAGGNIVNSVPAEHAIRAVLPVGNIEGLAARDDVKFVRPASIAIFNTGHVNSQGDITHRSNQARSQLGATGKGVRVGVLSDSIDDTHQSLKAALQSGDLDGKNSGILNDKDGFSQAGRGEGEGLAMMEIVHDLAPAAQIIFATATGGPSKMAENIRGLAKLKCKVIIDDIAFSDESPFQDGVVARAVNDVSAAGVLYFSSAANSGNLQSGNSGTWEGNFVSGGSIDPLGQKHLFKPGTFLNTVTQASGNFAVLFWSDPLGKSSNDYDLFVINGNGDIVDASNTVQDGFQDPIEGVAGPKQGEKIAIFKYSGQPRYLHLDTSRARLAVGTTGSTKGHNASGAANAFCVAAAPAANGIGQGNPSGPFPNPYNPNSKVENFSSDGFRRVFFNVNGSAITPGNFSANGGRLLKKPDITAADGVGTTLPPTSGLNPFFGTSAAAPHAGAIAAQVISRKPSASPAQVRHALESSAIDILAGGVDPASGQGIVMALPAVQAIANSAGVDQLQTADDEPLSNEPDVQLLESRTQ